MAEDILVTNSDSNSKHPKQNPAGNEVLNGNHQHYAADPEAQEMVIESLRNQIQDLVSQVTQLNSKLVKSYDRVSDLEDDLHVSSAQLRSSTVKISQLELERTQHLAALNTGLLVEKHHVTTELNRLMEKATDEAAQRGQAESARAAIEKELDDLSASLFNQANTMVAEARYAQHISQRKAEDAEQALRSAEEAVSAMQQQVQTLQAEKETAEEKTVEMQSLMGKGKWVDKRNSQSLAPTLRLFSSHLPYQEFLLFVGHLRHLHMSSLNPPAMHTLLPLPFLTRLSTEDSEPSVRLDLAPSLNWLSRRSVLAAIHNGQLTIEPMSFTTLLMESAHLSNAGISGSGNNEYVPCALCGTSVFPQAPSTNTSPTRPPSHPLTGMAHTYSGSGSSWSTSLFKKSSISLNSTTSSPSSVLPRSLSRTTQLASNPIYPSQVYIFRIVSAQTSTLPQLPLLKSSSSASASGTSTPTSSYQNTPALGSVSPAQSSSTIYPLCTSGWCLARLRTTCSMWAFIRTSVVEKVWEEELPVIIPPPVPNRTATATPTPVESPNPMNGSGAPEKPPLPPRKRGLWGLASAIGERAASWSESASDKERTKKASISASPEKDKKDPKTLPPPPPHRPQERPDVIVSETTPVPLHPQAGSSAIPPPLPRRSENRAQTPVPPSTATPPSPTPVESAVSSTTNVSLTDPATAQSATKTTSPALESKPDMDGSDRAVPSPDLPASTFEPAAVAAALSTPPQTPTRPQALTSSATPLPPIPPRAVKRLSTSFARPNTPSNIPLPESRPATPVAVPSTPNPPSRTSSPAVGNSSAAPGAPPPVPKRAVARAARKPVGDSGANSRPSSPALPPSPAKTGDPQAQTRVASAPPQPHLDSVKEAAEEKKEEKKEDEQPPSPPEEAPAPHAIEHAPSMQSTISTVSDTEAFVDAEDGMEEAEKEDGQEDDEVRTVKEVKETKKTPEGDGDNNAEETKQEEPIHTPEQTEDLRPVVSLNDEDLPSVTPSNPPPIPPRKLDSEKHQINEVNGAKSDGPDNSEGGGHVYIGEATWEERTWKELTRLREAMFWARIGAVRS